MLLKGYHLEIFNNECKPDAMTVQCFAHLDQDVSQAIPYLNAILGGFEYIQSPPSVTFRAQGKLISVYGRKLAVNALKDEAEARKIVEWLKREINAAWDQRDRIQPKFDAAPRPKIIDILRLLPKSNCGQCGASTCMVFATQAAEGAKGAQDCPPLEAPDREKLSTYLEPFQLDG